MNKEFFTAHKDQLLQSTPDVMNFATTFRSVNKRWNSAITAGMIETGSMKADESKLFEPLIQDMKSTKNSYSEIQEQLVDAILYEMAKKTVLEINDSAKFVINILKRNLFERTADVGYLATDSDIVTFLKEVAGDLPVDDKKEKTATIRRRLSDYQYEYTVYDEIIIVDTEGRVMANLDERNTVRQSFDPLLRKTQAIHLDTASEPYVETYRPSDLRPGHDSVLIYSQKIVDPDNGQSLGTLCLCFDFDDEMEGIFKDMSQGNNHMILAILDESGKVMSCNDTGTLPVGQSVSIDLKSDCRHMLVNGTPYLVRTIETDGYQGFMGLTWYGLAMIDTRTAFQKNMDEFETDHHLISSTLNFSSDLSALKKRSDDLLEDMKLDSINGQIRAMEFHAKAFIEVLFFVKEISEEIGGILTSAIGNLQETIVTSLFNEVQFRAFQGNNIADRNLYERANDVCWWALTPLFRRLLAQNMDQELTDEDKKRLKDNLQYINNLYTPYLRLALADTKGEIIAVSDPPAELSEAFTEEGLPRGQEFVGTFFDKDLVTKALRLTSRKDYCVSEFKPTPLYGGRHTYIYSTPVREPGNDKRPVGIIGIVFDSEPQFSAMLEDALPKNHDQNLEFSGFGLFVDRKKNIISSTTPRYPVGSTLALDDSFFKHPKGGRVSSLVELDSQTYTLGLQVSEGYREYKRDDGYVNEVICMIFCPV